MTDDLDKFRFNRAVARIRELTNAIEELPEQTLRSEPAAPAVLREGLETLARLLGPMMPHLAEEMWQTLGGAGLLAEQPWPVADPELVRDEQVTIAVQVNGKLRGTLEFPRDTESGAVESAALGIAAGGALARRPAAAQGHRRAEPDRQHRRLTWRGRRACWPWRRHSGPAVAGLRLGAALRRSRKAGRRAPICARSRSSPISERIGQRLEMALRNSLNPTGEPTKYRYTLRTTLTVSLSDLGIQSQGTATLGRLDVYANSVL